MTFALSCSESTFFFTQFDRLVLCAGQMQAAKTKEKRISDKEGSRMHNKDFDGRFPMNKSGRKTGRPF
jgi:hypothetical protein